MTAPVGFSEIDIRYLPEIPHSQRYSEEQEMAGDDYLGSIVLSAAEIEKRLANDFVHVDGALVFDEATGQPRVQNVSAIVGKVPFARGFRNAVNRQTRAAGGVKGAFLPRKGYGPLDEMVRAQLHDGVEIEGDLIVALAAEFEYELRPLNEGGEQLALPPDLHELLEDGEEPFEPLVATGQATPAERGYHTVNVIQGIYGHIRDGKRLITARVGLVYDDERAVPFSIARQIQASRSQGPAPVIPAPEDVVRTLMRHAESTR